MYEILHGLAVTGALTMFLWGGGCSRNEESALVDMPDPDKAAATLSDIRADEVVVFYPTAAHYDASNSQWIVPIHGIIYEPEQGLVETRGCRGVDSAGRGSGNRIAARSTVGRKGPAVPGRQ